MAGGGASNAATSRSPVRLEDFGAEGGMRWTRILRLCGLCLLGWEHRECQEGILRIPWWAARAVRRAYREASW